MASPLVLPDFAPEDVWQWTTEEVQRAIEAGILKDAELYELIGGRLVRKMAKGEAHILVHGLLLQALAQAFAGTGFVRSEAPVAVSRHTEPEPDFMVIPKQIARDNIRPRGDQAILAIEISVTLVKDDLGWKRDLYAQSCVPEYWVIDCMGRRAYIHRRPDDGDYRSIEVLHEEDELPHLSIPLAEILP